MELPQVADGAPTGNACNPTGDNDAISYWSQWIASKLAGGLNLPGMEEGMKSLVQLVVSNAEMGAKLAKGAAATRGGPLGPDLPVGDVDAGRLDQQHTQSRGPDQGDEPRQRGVITATLKYDLEKSSLDGGSGVKNCLLIMANALGIQNALPADGGVVGAQLKFLGRGRLRPGPRQVRRRLRRVPPDRAEITQDTGDGGIATIHVRGLAQKKKIPDSAVEWPREPTIRIYAQPEAENARSLASTFWDSFVAEGAGPVGPIAPILDILKGTMFDLGEYSFQVTDWLVGWTIASKFDNNPMTGQKCDAMDGEWVAKAGLNQPPLNIEESYTLNFPENSLQGTYKFTNNTVVTSSAGTAVAVQNGTSTVTMVPQKDGTIIMNLDPVTVTAIATTGGNSVSQQLTIPGVTLTWAPKQCDEPAP